MSEQTQPKPQIKVLKDGPYEVIGDLPIAKQTIVPNEAGESVRWEQGESFDPPSTPAHLCRCGHSGHKPFCDGSHKKVGFDGTETATHAPYLEGATEQDGPRVTLTDNTRLCAFARFCDREGQVWNLVEQDSERAAELTVQESVDCPSGRLVAWNQQERAAYEPEFEPSIGIVEDPAMGVSGPLWVRGDVEVVSADGEPYEVRNRQTLCRCGESRNKPFCDGRHAPIEFHDGL